MVDTTTKATKPKTIEQVACLETALRAIEKPRIETPAQMLILLACEAMSGGWRDAHPGNDVDEFRDFSSDEGPSLVPVAELFRNDADCC